MANELPPTTSKRQRAELGTYVLRIQPTERCDVTAIDPEDLRRAIGSLAIDAALLRRELLRVSKLANSITVTTCDPTQVGRVRQMTIRSRFARDARSRYEYIKYRIRGHVEGRHSPLQAERTHRETT